MEKSKVEFLRTLPKKIIAAGVLLFHKDKLLIVKPKYRDCWLIPGGVVEKNETPLKAAIRETKEEIGLAVKIKQLLAVDYKDHRTEGTPDTLRYVFLGNNLNKKMIDKIKLQEDEISEYKIVSINKAVSLLCPGLDTRLKACIIAMKNNKTLYLENGKIHKF